MKKIFFVFIACLTLSTLLNSCSIEKRLHQDGYHISWSHRLFSNKNEGSYEIAKKKIVDHDVYSAENSIDQNPVNLPSEPNNHSVETTSANTSETLILSARKKSIVNSPIDTITPKEETKQEEYFSNNYTNPLPTNELQDTKLANWALGLGIGALSAPVLGFVIAIILAILFSIDGLTALGLAILLGAGIFIVLEILAITFAIRFLRMHGKDPNYRKYRSRAITGLILAGIYPAIMLLNIIIGLAMI
jgi:hypothetical protein